MIRAKPEVARLEPYAAPLEGRRPMLRLDFNENTVGPSPRVVEAVRGLPPAAYATYPEYAGLNEAYAAWREVPAVHVQAFNGVDAAIQTIFEVYGSTGETFLTTAPTFGYYNPCALRYGMRPDEVAYPADLRFPLAALRKRLARGPRLCFLCNPNNPTGTLLDPAAVLDLARGAPRTLVVVDETYVDFTRQSVLPAALALDNVVVLQSLSKAVGLAALRLGFAIGPEEVVRLLRRATGPYDVNAFAVTAGMAALADREYIEEYVHHVLEAKQWTVARLRDLGVRVFADGGNYVLVWPGQAGIEEALRERGLLVRSMRGKPVIDGSFRLSIGTREQMGRFMREFGAVLADAADRG